MFRFRCLSSSSDRDLSAFSSHFREAPVLSVAIYLWLFKTVFSNNHCSVSMARSMAGSYNIETLGKLVAVNITNHHLMPRSRVEKTTTRMRSSASAMN